MKKIIILATLFCCYGLSFAQIKVTGTIWDEMSKDPVIGASINVKGSTIGTISDVDGTFEITVESATALLEVRYLGYKSKDVAIGNKRVLEIFLSEDVTELQETVVTALGVVKEKKVLGYSVQEIKGNDIAVSRDANPFSSLTGKIAGLQVATSTDLMKSPVILLRGVIPLIVVDGMPIASDTWNISPDDIENISVLKGPTAAALYGSIGKNGAVQITTKKGSTDKKKISIDFNSGTQFQTGYLAMPKAQSEYGAGYDYQYSFGDGEKGNVNGINNSDSDVWGPRFEGQSIKQYDSPIDPATGVRTPTPWIARGADNLKNYLETGLIETNSIAVASSGERSDFRIALSDTYQKGILPNTKLNSFNFNMSGGMDISKSLRVDAVINYNKTTSPNYPDVIYNPRSPIYTIAIWSGANYDIRDLRNYWKPGQEGLQQNNYDYAQYNNMYFQAYENTRGHYNDDVHGNVSLKWRITPDLDVKMKSNVSTFFLNKNEKYADYVEYVVEKEGDIGIFLAEPIRNTDVQIPSRAYWKRIREICDKHSIVLIFDEIPLALGRTGRMFAFEHFDIEPDILCLGKGLGGGVIPFAAMIAREEFNIAKDVSLGHYTHEKSPLGSVAALASIEYIEKYDLLNQIALREKQMQQILDDWHDKYPIIGDIRGKGLLWGIELVEDRSTKTPAIGVTEKILYSCLKNGLSFKISQGNVIQLCPPVNINAEDLDCAMKILENSICRIAF